MAELNGYSAAAIMALAAGAVTWVGGAVGLRLERARRLLIAFSLGAILALSFFDLAPDAAGLTPGAHPWARVAVLATIGFSAYGAIRWALQRLGSRAGDHIGLASLSLHSVFDGLGIGLGFQVSAPLGLVLAAAILAHDFADGVNTVSLGVARTGQVRLARRWLVVNALAPVFGVMLSGLAAVSHTQLGWMLAWLVGAFAYVAIVDLSPQALRAPRTASVFASTAAGVAWIWAVSLLSAGR